MPKTLAELCVPRSSVFDPSIRDTVYDINSLGSIDPKTFFAENYVTQGMRQLLTEAFKRLEGKSQSAAGAFLLSQSMGGGKTHNLIALALLAKHPELRRPVMSSFYEPGPLGAVKVAAFSGRKTNTPYGIWGEIAGQLNKSDVFGHLYSPLRPPGEDDWIELLGAEPVLILLDELPPYFQQAQAQMVGNTSLDVITTTALANLLTAVISGKAPQACVVLTDLRGSAYSIGSAHISAALGDLEQEANRSVQRIDPVRLNSDELYHIMRTRLFEKTASSADIESVADAYLHAVEEARQTDMTTASPQTMRGQIVNSYPFHPAIRDLYARFRENPGFQQTRALIRLMRLVTADLWKSGQADRQYLIGAHDLDLHDPAIISEIRQINGTFDNAIAHDIANDGHSSVAEAIDGPTGRDAQDAARLIFMASLSQAVNPTLGLDRSSIVAYLAAPGREVGGLRAAVDALQAEAWYLHATGTGLLLFKNTENLNAKLESYANAILSDERENELRDRLAEMFKIKLGSCYQDLRPLPALNDVVPSQDRITLVIFRPVPGAKEEVKNFWSFQDFRNRLLFLTGNPSAYERVLQRAAYLRAIKAIIQEFQQQGVRESEPQMQDAREILSREEGQFYIACREAFQTLLYPHTSGLVEIELDPKYVANKYEGEEQVIAALTDAHKFRPNASIDDPGFETSLENKLWPPDAKQVAWNEIKRRAAMDPSWLWHHPRALDDLKNEAIKRDLWRDIGSGFIERGPFPKPDTSVSVQMLYRNPDTGAVRLRVKPLHGDRVTMAAEGPATKYSTQLDDYEIETADLRLSFLGIDSTGGHQTGDAVEWKNEITLKHRFFQDGDGQRCELQAIPSGAIRYTIDGSSPDTSGVAYTEPFLVPKGTKYVLAKAAADGVSSALATFEVKATESGVVVDPKKPVIWRRSFKNDATAEVYTFLEELKNFDAAAGGVRLVAQRDQRFVELLTDERVFQPSPTLLELASLLSGMLSGSPNLTMDVAALEFKNGQDLLDMVKHRKTELKAGEVEQPS